MPLPPLPPEAAEVLGPPAASEATRRMIRAFMATRRHVAKNLPPNKKGARRHDNLA